MRVQLVMKIQVINQYLWKNEVEAGGNLDLRKIRNNNNKIILVTKLRGPYQSNHKIRNKLKENLNKNLKMKPLLLHKNQLSSLKSRQSKKKVNKFNKIHLMMSLKKIKDRQKFKNNKVQMRKWVDIKKIKVKRPKGRLKMILIALHLKR